MKNRIVLTFIFIFSLLMLARTQSQYRDIMYDKKEAIEIAGLQESEPVIAESVAVSDLQPDNENNIPEEITALKNIDLKSLQDINPDIIGWIEIPNTDLSYPLLYGEDNQYYLDHNWKKERNDGGSVFLDAAGNKDFSGFHEIIYAHRMRNDSMFGTLRYYKDQEYLQEHPKFYIVLDSAVYEYDIFSARNAGVKSITYRLDIKNSSLEGEFLQDCLVNSIIDTGIVPDIESQFVTLSTCTGSGHSDRFVVHGVLSNIYELGS